MNQKENNMEWSRKYSRLYYIYHYIIDIPYIIKYKCLQFISRSKRYEAVYLPKGNSILSRRFDSLDDACQYINRFMPKGDGEWMVWDYKLKKIASEKDI